MKENTIKISIEQYKDNYIIKEKILNEKLNKLNESIKKEKEKNFDENTELSKQIDYLKNLNEKHK
jgi:hypothetical protein